VLLDLICEEQINHEVKQRYYPQSIEELNLIVVYKVICMLMDANLTPKLWPYVAQCCHRNQKNPNDDYEDSSDFSKIYVLCRICNADGTMCKRKFSWNQSCLLHCFGPSKQSYLCSKNCGSLRRQVSLHRGMPISGT